VSRRKGFTLVEVMVTIGVIAVLFAGVVYGVGAVTGSKAKEGTALLSATIRSLYDTAALSGRTCRLVFELPKERDDDGQVKYRAECAKGAVTASAKRDDELRDLDKNEREKKQNDDRLKRLDSDSAPTVEQLQAREKQRVEEQAAFSGFASDDVGERTLPKEVRMEIWTGKQRSAAKTGKAFLYFFPQGFTEKAHLVVRQGKNAWTVVVSPLTGKTSVVGEALEVPR
jgi:general secretion pathway protein H